MPFAVLIIVNFGAHEFHTANFGTWGKKTLIYLDPPYYEKGRLLYHDAYSAEDHKNIAEVVAEINGVSWIVSYDDIRPIHDLYENARWLQYTLPYSARNRVRGREAMFFSDGLTVPDIPKPLIEVAQGDGLLGAYPIPIDQRSFAAA